MDYSEKAMGAILLCSYLGLEEKDSLKPFSLGEWNAFLDDLMGIEEEISILFSNDQSWKDKLHYSDEQLERISGLLARGVKVAFELDSLEKKGIRVVTLFDADYPILLRRKLKKKCRLSCFMQVIWSLQKKLG